MTCQDHDERCASRPPVTKANGIAKGDAASSRFGDLLSAFGWSGQRAAREFGVTDRTIRRWRSGAVAAPDRLVTWLDGMVRHLRANPPPAPPARDDAA